MYDCRPCSNDAYLWLGLAALVLGAVFLLEGLGYIPVGTGSFVWPALLVIIGIKFIILGSSNKNCCDGDCDLDWEMMEETEKMPAKKASTPKKKTSKKK